MSKRVHVLGMEIDNHTIRETMFLLEEYVGTEGLNFVGVLTPEILMAAVENPDVYGLVEQMDMHIIGDVAILEVLDDVYEQQAAEVAKRELEEVFLQMLIRKKKNVYWVSDEESDLTELTRYMEEHYPKLNIAGSFTGDLEDNVDSFINDINSVAPDVIFIQTASWRKPELLMKHKNRLNAKLCVYLNYRVRSKYYALNRNSKIKSLIDTTMFKRKAIRYQMNREE